MAMLARAARRSGNCDDEGRPRWDSPKTALCVCLIIGLSGMVCTPLLYHHLNPARIDATQAVTLAALPKPPSPYEYSTFMSWMRKADFSKIEGIKWRPEVSEFDIDAAATGSKFTKWLVGDEAKKAVAASKSINKYAFFSDIIATGDLTTVGSPGTHLYVLTKLLHAAKGVKNPTFLDAGCGVGLLLPAWVLATGGTGRAVGLEVDSSTAAAAQAHLTKPDAYDARATKELQDARMEARTGNALSPSIEAVTGLLAGSVDAINMGAAVEREADLATLVRLLRPGGLLSVTICSPLAPDAPKAPRDMCAGIFKVFEKKDDGSIQRQAGDPDIPSKTVIARISVKGSLRGAH